jgi:hypothetical protein
MENHKLGMRWLGENGTFDANLLEERLAGKALELRKE